MGHGSSLDAAPALTWVAAAAAIVDLALNRFLVRSLGDSVSHGTLIELSELGALPRNLAAIAGVVALGGATWGLLRLRGSIPLRRRVVLAAFAGIFLPTVVIAAVSPPENVSASTILFGAGAANVLVVLMGTTAVRWSSPLGVRIGVALASASAFFALGALVAQLVGNRLTWDTTAQLAGALRRTGEIGYLCAPLAVGVTLLGDRRVPRFVVCAAASVATVALTMGLMLWGESVLRSDFAIVLYGAQGLELLLEVSPLIYAVVLALGFGAAAGGLAQGLAPARQAGAGVLLTLCGGYSPRSASELLMMVLGMALLSRATIALAERAAKQPAEPSHVPMEQLDRELGPTE